MEKEKQAAKIFSELIDTLWNVNRVNTVSMVAIATN